MFQISPRTTRTSLILRPLISFWDFGKTFLHSPPLILSLRQGDRDDAPVLWSLRRYPSSLITDPISPPPVPSIPLPPGSETEKKAPSIPTPSFFFFFFFLSLCTVGSSQSPLSILFLPQRTFPPYFRLLSLEELARPWLLPQN